MPDWQALFSALRDFDLELSDREMPHPVTGGDISASWRGGARASPVFLKTGPASSYEMFTAEAEGLRELAGADAVLVPKVLGCIQTAAESLLALEWIDVDLPGPDTEILLGRQLAKQHRCYKDRFGWHRDNTIGSTPQQNAWSDDWIGFFTKDRIGFQLALAAENGFTGELQREGRKLMSDPERFFGGYRPEPSLLHGDLWGGNWASWSGKPVIFDPAVYYGDRESDLAMTRLFGGFGAAFYRAYEEAWPLAPGNEERMLLYQLYHILNHLNLFGRSYLGRALGIIRSLA